MQSRIAPLGQKVHWAPINALLQKSGRVFLVLKFVLPSQRPLAAFSSICEVGPREANPGEPHAASRGAHRGTTSWKALRDKGFAQPPTSTAGWAVWQKLLKWVTHNSYSSIFFALFGILHFPDYKSLSLILVWLIWCSSRAIVGPSPRNRSLCE